MLRGAVPDARATDTDAAQGKTVEGGDRGLLERVDANIRWRSERLRWGGADGARLRKWAYRYHPPPIPSFSGLVEPVPPEGTERIGVCCSGGGIRSAAFNLGALQALQDGGELQKATYLAAVSGGSYIAAAFAMVAKTGPPTTDDSDTDDSDPDDSDLDTDDSDPDLIRELPPFAPGSPEEQYLRNRSSYMAPDAMGKLFLAYRFVLGLLFNVLFLSAPLFAVMALLGWWVYRPTHRGLVACDGKCSTYVPAGFWIAPTVVIGVSLLLGVAVLLWRSSSDEWREGLQAWSARLLLASMLLALFAIGLPELVALAHNVHLVLRHPGDKAAVLGGGGLTGLVAGALAYVRETVLTPKKALEAVEQGQRALGSKVRVAAAYAATALAGPVLLVIVMAAGLGFALNEPASSFPKTLGMPTPVAVGVLVLASFAVLYFLADIASWSLHPYYKRRLCTAFALKRVKARDGEGLSRKDVKRLSKLGDGPGWLERPVAVERDFDRLVPLSETAFNRAADSPSAVTDGPRWPTLIVCAAANVSDEGATPPGRKVTSFTFSPHAVGGPLVGATPTESLEKAFGRASRFGAGSRRRARDLTLPAAVAISGAAVAPSMGKMTRPSMRFLLALANVRLGVWVPNPRWVRSVETSRTWWAWIRRHLFARPRPSYLINELIGRNHVNARYLFVTDGGHYENLGLVELLRRGCTRIYCFDASGGRADGALGDAIALARSELGVEIEINDASRLVPEGVQDIAKTNAVTGRFTHGGGREGVLVYARCVMTADLPQDVKAHHEEDPAFPHNSTVDQLYTDQKFESYRKLGRCAGERTVRLMSSCRESLIRVQ